MAGPILNSRPRRRTPADAAARRASTASVRTLLVIDNAPLQAAAWTEFQTARRQLDKATRDLHRHENVDLPAYDEWLHRTFPVFITTLRELHQEVLNKSRQVQAVQAMAALTGRSLKKLWREQKEYEADPEAFEKHFPSADDDREADQAGEAWGDTDGFFRGDDRSRHSAGEGFRDTFSSESAPHPPPGTTREARAIYRRLVQRLHPDRGGEFTPARQRLWHEVQQAWAAGDADWLARLEVEWETSNEILGPTSPLSRLRRAMTELRAARRDAERKLREYRGSFPWRFTLSPKKRDALHRRTGENFQHDIGFLRRQLAYLNATIAAWEESPRRRSRSL